jgi:hypothetical protein
VKNDKGFAGQSVNGEKQKEREDRKEVEISSPKRFPC